MNSEYVFSVNLKINMKKSPNMLGNCTLIDKIFVYLTVISSFIAINNLNPVLRTTGFFLVITVLIALGYHQYRTVYIIPVFRKFCISLGTPFPCSCLLY